MHNISTFTSRSLTLSAIAGMALLVTGAGAQETSLVSMSDNAAVASAAISSSGTSSTLPDAPSAVAAEPMFAGGAPQSPSSVRTAGPHDKIIYPGEQAPKLNVQDKAILGIKDALAPFTIIGWVLSAGYEQATNGSPNYAQTGKGFAQRVGASAARATSETVFGESILAPILHEDPRYYKVGKSHNFVYRTAYAATRPIIGRTDGGHLTLNIQDLGGDLAGAALTQAYYPPLNRGVSETMKTFAGSVGGDALGFVVTEFIGNAVELFHKVSK